MAAPQEITCKNLQGKWAMNKGLCTRTEDILVLQGISWITRKAIGLASVTLHVKVWEGNGIMKIDIDSVVAGGLKGTTEKRTLDWTRRGHNDHIFGSVEGLSRSFTGLNNLESMTKLPDGSKDPKDEAWLKNEKFEDKDGLFIQSWVESTEAGWTAEQIWGFEMVDGVRHYTRRVVVRKGKEVERGWLVYNYVGPLDE